MYAQPEAYREDLEPPPVLDWSSWYARQWRRTRQGTHVLFDGPTQSGKTVLCRLVTRLNAYAVVFGTKPVDPSLDAYAAEGYTRIDHWPPTPSDYRKARAAGATYSYVKDGGKRVRSDPAVRFLLWPRIKTRADLRRYRSVYAAAMEGMFIEGRWCFVIDEGLWMASRNGLDLGQQMRDMAYGSASNKVSMHLLVQRPANLPPDCWTNCGQALIFHGGHPDDIRKLASLSVYQPRQAQQAIARLRGHQFLDLPCHAGAEWAVSQVDPAAI